MNIQDHSLSCMEFKMKNIRGHKSWSFEEVLQLLRKGSFSVPTLPHYRYDAVKRHRSNLVKIGFIRQSGRCDTSISYTATDKFREWANEYDNKQTTLMPVKWAKERKRHV